MADQEKNIVRIIPDMLSFISLYHDNVIEVNKVELQDYDGDEGMIYENYIVEVTMSTGEDRTCLVNRNEFRRWRAKEQAVKFI